MPIRGKRNSNFEILKLTAVVLIILSSALPYGLTYTSNFKEVFVNLNQTQFSLTHIIFTLFRWAGQIGDTLFIMVSAYFLCDRQKIRLEKTIRMIIDTWTISVFGLIIALYFMHPSLTEIIHSIMPVRYAQNWFVGCYIIYYLITPLLNRAVFEIHQTTFKKIVFVLFLFYSVLGSIQQEYYYTYLVGFICIHYFVSYFKRYHITPSVEKSESNIVSSNRIKHDISGISIALSMIVLWIIGLNFGGQYFGAISHRGLFACSFINPAIIAIGLFALDLAANAMSSNIKWVNSITKYSLLIYLIHASYFWLNYGKYGFNSMLRDIGISPLVRVLITIIMYLILTPILSALYSKLTDTGLNKFSIFISNKILDVK